MGGGCKDNTSNDPFSRCKSVQQFGYRWKLTITECSLTTTWTATSRRKELYNWYCVCVVKTHDTNVNVTTKTQSTFRTKHMNIDTWSECARSSPVCFVSQVLVVMIAHHIVGSSFTCARHLMVITWWAYLLHSFLLPIFSFISNLLHFLLHFFHNLEGSCNTAYFAWKETDLPWRLLPPHRD